MNKDRQEQDKPKWWRVQWQDKTCKVCGVGIVYPETRSLDYTTKRYMIDFSCPQGHRWIEQHEWNPQ